MKHAEVHPALDVEGCWKCKVSSISYGADALPTRRPDSNRTNAKERVLAKDLDAYKRLRQDGVQPQGIDGAARLEARAETKDQVEHARFHRLEDSTR